MSQVKQNIRIRFTKEGDIRFVSHHDLMRVFERALRRAELPIAMSEGYHPRPRMSLPAALSVGYIGLNEVADVGLRRWVRPGEFCARLQAELPQGVRILTARVTSPHPNRQPLELSYRVPLREDHAITTREVDDLLARDEVTVIRRRKDESRQVEIRHAIKALRLEDGAVLMLLSCGNRGTARPEEVMESLGAREGVDYLQSAIERTHVRLASSS